MVTRRQHNDHDEKKKAKEKGEKGEKIDCASTATIVMDGLCWLYLSLAIVGTLRGCQPCSSPITHCVVLNPFISQQSVTRSDVVQDRGSVQLARLARDLNGFHTRTTGDSHLQHRLCCLIDKLHRYQLRGVVQRLTN
jgi:hypothetical protein